KFRGGREGRTRLRPSADTINRLDNSCPRWQLFPARNKGEKDETDTSRLAAPKRVRLLRRPPSRHRLALPRFRIRASSQGRSGLRHNCALRALLRRWSGDGRRNDRKRVMATELSQPAIDRGIQHAVARLAHR